MVKKLTQPHTVFIAATGKTPITLTVRPLTVMLSLAISLGMPVAWIGHLLYHNMQLARHNQDLTETATEVLTELNSLDAEIETLKNRAGVPEASQPPSQRSPSSLTPRGGAANTVAPDVLFELAQHKLPKLTATLDTAVKPALEKTLMAEAQQQAAFPKGLPLAGELKISSEFGLRLNPFGGRNYEIHDGLDFSGPVGEPILATAEGVVIQAENGGGYGLHVRLDHGFGYETLYGHMSDIQVKIGDRVKRGDIIGYLGNTGRSSGPHLHYSIYRHGEAVNPRYYLKLRDAEL